MKSRLVLRSPQIRYLRIGYLKISWYVVSEGFETRVPLAARNSRTVPRIQPLNINDVSAVLLTGLIGAPWRLHRATLANLLAVLNRDYTIIA
ncbi:hypothetical protein HZH66_014517 [Vespula vulgaris]|uniref:Uncharacterized protein n=2 Tax=Vespula TaxID=7451 RepID=A0A834JQ91_VESPE|nr:hypothetical protein HZH66_014517 [Vespula vulgaris]KAF7392287.1 hypothetical protein H0235_017286 [Vespula pensylvanica]